MLGFDKFYLIKFDKNAGQGPSLTTMIVRINCHLLRMYSKTSTLNREALIFSII